MAEEDLQPLIPPSPVFVRQHSIRYHRRPQLIAGPHHASSPHYTSGPHHASGPHNASGPHHASGPKHSTGPHHTSESYNTFGTPHTSGQYHSSGPHHSLRQHHTSGPHYSLGQHHAPTPPHRSSSFSRTQVTARPDGAHSATQYFDPKFVNDTAGSRDGPDQFRIRRSYTRRPPDPQLPHSELQKYPTISQAKNLSQVPPSSPSNPSNHRSDLASFDFDEKQNHHLETLRSTVESWTNIEQQNTQLRQSGTRHARRPSHDEDHQTRHHSLLIERSYSFRASSGSSISPTSPDPAERSKFPTVPTGFTRRQLSLPITRRLKHGRHSSKAGTPPGDWTAQAATLTQTDYLALLPTPPCDQQKPNNLDQDGSTSAKSLLRRRNSDMIQYSDRNSPDEFEHRHRQMSDSFSSGSSLEDFPCRHSSLPPLQRVKQGRCVARRFAATQQQSGGKSDDAAASVCRAGDDGGVERRAEVRRGGRPQHDRCGPRCTSPDAPRPRHVTLKTHYRLSEVFGTPVEKPPMSKECENHIKYLIEKDKEFLEELDAMIHDYPVMCQVAPGRIRQHFDVLFQQLIHLRSFQTALYDAIKDASRDICHLARIFQDQQFEIYGRYMVTVPSVQIDFHRYSSYFEENFPNLKRNILKPSMRVNFYVMSLDGIKKLASEEEKKELQKSITFLNRLKRTANTDITLNTIENSPVDLRLEGDMLHDGELVCLAGGPLQKKKYKLILFENMLVIVSSKISIFKYKVHYRAEHLHRVEASGKDELLIHVLSQGQQQASVLRFRAQNSSVRDVWVKELQKMGNGSDISSLTPDGHTYFGGTSKFMKPLSLFSVYPQLKLALEDASRPSVAASPDDLCQQLLDMERKYIRQLELVLHPEVPEPPPVLQELLCQLYEKHSKVILPNLERSWKKTCDSQDTMTCFLQQLQQFDLYTRYLVVRSQLTTVLDATVEAKLYVAPVHQLHFYLTMLKHLAHDPDHQPVASQARTLVYNYITAAQVKILSDAIRQCRVDFNRSGNLVCNNSLEVRSRKKGFRQGVYQVLLFQKVMVLIRPRPPHYEYAWDIWLDQANPGPPSTQPTCFKLEVRQGRGRDPDTFEFQAEQEEVKQRWVTCLHQQLVIQAEKIRRRASNLILPT